MHLLVNVCHICVIGHVLPFVQHQPCPSAYLLGHVLPSMQQQPCLSTNPHWACFALHAAAALPFWLPPLGIFCPSCSISPAFLFKSIGASFALHAAPALSLPINFPGYTAFALRCTAIDAFDRKVRFGSLALSTFCIWQEHALCFSDRPF